MTPSSTASAPAAEQQAGQAEVVAAAVLAVPGVVALHPGPFGEVATLLPGRRVPGVRLADPAGAPRASEVHVVVTAQAPVHETAAAVHAALAPLVPGPLQVVVGDVLTPAEQQRPGDDPGA